jgi:glutathione S-transferase
LILDWVNEEYAGGMWTPDEQDVAVKRRNAFLCEFAICTLLVKADFVLILSVLGDMLPWPLSWLARAVNFPLVHHFAGDLGEIFAYLEDVLSEELPWFAGREMGTADFNMSFGFDLAEHRGFFKGDRFPRLKDWSERVRGREAYKKAKELSGGYDLKGFGGVDIRAEMLEAKKGK